MSQYYNPKRLRGLFAPNAKDPFKLSRSKIDLFIECPRCFYLDRKLGIGRPPGFPFSLNSAVDILLKKEFDLHRAKKEAHPLMKHYGIKAVPFDHPKMKEWRNPFQGIQFLHPETNLLIFGAIDDLWQDEKNRLIIVDYKSTSTSREITLDDEWKKSYKRQMEIYQWLFLQNGFDVSETGYFVYCNGNTDKSAFDGKLEFDVKILPYKGDVTWISKLIFDIKKCLSSSDIPCPNPNCDYCLYQKNVQDIEKQSKKC